MTAHGPHRTVAGLDLSLNATGVATHYGLHVIKGGDRADEQRIDWIGQELLRYHTIPGSTLMVVMEGLSYGTKDRYIFERAGLHWHVRCLLWRFDIPVAIVPPSTLKVYATGSGKAEKADLRVELLKRTGIDERDNNKVDAWWLRAMGHQALGAPLLELPRTHLRAMEKVAWPEGVPAHA